MFSLHIKWHELVAELGISVVEEGVRLPQSTSPGSQRSDYRSDCEHLPRGLWVYMQSLFCLLYTSDAADDLLCVDLGGRRIIKKKKKNKKKKKEEYSKK